MGTIRIRAGFLPLAFLLFLFPARVRIDGGERQSVGWFKDVDLSVTPGTHHILADHGYFVPGWNHEAEIDVTVQDGQTVNVKYRARVLAFLPGKIHIA